MFKDMIMNAGWNWYFFVERKITANALNCLQTVKNWVSSRYDLTGEKVHPLWAGNSEGRLPPAVLRRRLIYLLIFASCMSGVLILTAFFAA